MPSVLEQKQRPRCDPALQRPLPEIRVLKIMKKDPTVGQKGWATLNLNMLKQLFKHPYPCFPSHSAMVCLLKPQMPKEPGQPFGAMTKLGPPVERLE